MNFQGTLGSLIEVGYWISVESDRCKMWNKHGVFNKRMEVGFFFKIWPHFVKNDNFLGNKLKINNCGVSNKRMEVGFFSENE